MLFSRTCEAEHHENHRNEEKDWIFCDRKEGHPVNIREQHSGTMRDGTRVYWR